MTEKILLLGFDPFLNSFFKNTLATVGKEVAIFSFEEDYLLWIEEMRPKFVFLQWQREKEIELTAMMNNLKTVNFIPVLGQGQENTLKIDRALIKPISSKQVIDVIELF